MVGSIYIRHYASKWGEMSITTSGLNNDEVQPKHKIKNLKGVESISTLKKTKSNLEDERCQRDLSKQSKINLVVVIPRCGCRE